MGDGPFGRALLDLNINGANLLLPTVTWLRNDEFMARFPTAVVIVCALAVAGVVWTLSAFSPVGSALPEPSILDIDLLRSGLSAEAAIGSGVALLLVLRTRRDRHFSVDTAIADRFHQAERLAARSPAARQRFTDLVCAYLRRSDADPGEQQAAGRRLIEHLRPESAGFWPGLSLDLTGATLVGFSLRGAVVEHAQFERAHFQGTAVFDQCAFTEWAGFTDAVFAGDATFDHTRFGGPARFDNARFAGDAGFDKARFGGDVSFAGTRFTGNAWFDSAEFAAGLTFRGGSVLGEAWFGGARFHGAADLSCCHTALLGGATARCAHGVSRYWPPGWQEIKRGAWQVLEPAPETPAPAPPPISDRLQR
ncbi:hypothetical protein D5S17_20070 [Pseudonocardiaceae bacterium YIM PH 21723]|nr:hypothetical protein D5S17_20070 [Pseudonocardiaceae bacterium YIM PH 21723]